jgi:hypothetical protein
MQVPTDRFPGRLRLRFSQLRRQPLYAAQVAASIRGLDSVLSVEANAVTGGLLIVYDVARADKSGLWPSLKDALDAHGLRESSPQRSPQSGAAPRGAWSEKVSDKVVGAMVEKLVERSALALVAAFL